MQLAGSQATARTPATAAPAPGASLAVEPLAAQAFHSRPSPRHPACGRTRGTWPEARPHLHRRSQRDHGVVQLSPAGPSVCGGNGHGCRAGHTVTATPPAPTTEERPPGPEPPPTHIYTCMTHAPQGVEITRQDSSSSNTHGAIQRSRKEAPEALHSHPPERGWGARGGGPGRLGSSFTSRRRCC